MICIDLRDGSIHSAPAPPEIVSIDGFLDHYYPISCIETDLDTNYGEICCWHVRFKLGSMINREVARVDVPDGYLKEIANANHINGSVKI